MVLFNLYTMAKGMRFIGQLCTVEIVYKSKFWLLARVAKTIVVPYTFEPKVKICMCKYV